LGIYEEKSRCHLNRAILFGCSYISIHIYPS
jgi:hypothetical protein